ncbi:hypothetical protein FRX31_005107, partial [Thalictrum thalictroides]
MVKKRWKLQGKVEIGLDGDMYYFKFNNAQNREDVLDGGSFFIDGKLFVVKALSIEVEENREISAENELPNEIKLKTSRGSTLTIPLEYTWKPDICTHYKMFGHKSANCLIKFPNQGKVNEKEVRVQRNQEASKINERQWKKVG